MARPTLKYRPLGTTGLQVSEISFGAGPVPGLMTAANALARQQEIVQRALEAGLNWFDTAATYGEGRSETNLGQALRGAGAAERVHVATKVRLVGEDLGRIKEAVKASVAASLRRLGSPRVALIQLHNSITARRGELPTSITPVDVLGRGGVLEAFTEVQAAGLVAYYGLTGLGDPTALRQVIQEGPWATVQVPVNLLQPRRQRLPAAKRQHGAEPDFIACCVERGIAVLAIRVLAGGALAGQPPSAHSLKTPFFPLALYERDQQKAEGLKKFLPPGMSLAEAAIRFVLADADVATALIGFGRPEQVEEAVRCAGLGPLPSDLEERLRTCVLADQRTEPP